MPEATRPSRILPGILPGILALSVLLRLGAALSLGNTVTDLPGIADQVSYHNLAVRISEGYGFTFDRLWWPLTPAGEPTAHWSYLYSLFLAGVYSLVGASPLVARLVQVLLVGVLHPWLAYRLGKRAFGEKPGLAAAAGTAVYLYFVYYSAALMTEAFYITAILGTLELSLVLVQDRNGSGKISRNREIPVAAALGLVLGITLLLRQVYLLFVPFLFLWIWWGQKRRQARNLLIAVAVMIAAILPATLFNFRQFDAFVLLNTNAGYAFFWGNHPVHGLRFMPILPQPGAYQRLIPEELRSLDEAALDRALLQRGLGFVADDPARFLQLSISRIPAYFQFWPSPRSGTLSNIARVGSFGLFLPLMAWGVVANFPRRWSAPQTIYLLFALVYTGVHLLTWALVRYRLPVDALLLIFAGPVLYRLLQAAGRLAGRRLRLAA